VVQGFKGSLLVKRTTALTRSRRSRLPRQSRTWQFFLFCSFQSDRLSTSPASVFQLVHLERLGSLFVINSTLPSTSSAYQDTGRPVYSELARCRRSKGSFDSKHKGTARNTNDLDRKAIGQEVDTRDINKEGRSFKRVLKRLRLCRPDTDQ
jgi:hypothetical protein